MISTEDNPFNPLTDYEEWMDWDQQHQYYTAEYIDSLCDPTVDYTIHPELLDAVYQEILRLNITGNYILVEA